MAENRTSKRRPIARKAHKYRVDKDLTTRSFCHALNTPMCRRYCESVCRVRFTYPEASLELAQVGPLLLIAGSEAAL